MSTQKDSKGQIYYGAANVRYKALLDLPSVRKSGIFPGSDFLSPASLMSSLIIWVLRLIVVDWRCKNMTASHFVNLCSGFYVNNNFFLKKNLATKTLALLA